ncbi:Spx/MgsR family RNA polymerase-binding regulatory protein [Sneathiella sp.]|uniref:Spx/MgsR family RNA polymerase-binding regulatory protein n=1 Tax=Sneathiella sp. TaxID=1964365 RepID=UPI002FDF463A
MIVYGLKNCDTCRKALKWLAEEGIPHRFHDVRKDGLVAEELARWLAAIDRNLLINRRGTTYRQLGDAEKAVLEGEDPAALLLTQPAVIKRPIFSKDGRYLVGFGEAEKATLKEWAR